MTEAEVIYSTTSRSKSRGLALYFSYHEARKYRRVFIMMIYHISSSPSVCKQLIQAVHTVRQWAVEVSRSNLPHGSIINWRSVRQRLEAPKLTRLMDYPCSPAANDGCASCQKHKESLVLQFVLKNERLKKLRTRPALKKSSSSTRRRFDVSV